jgi:uncharacterized protein
MLSAPVQTTLTALEMAQARRFTEIRDLFAPEPQTLVVPDALKTGWEAELGRQRPITSIGAPLTEPTRTGIVMVKVPISCERGGFTLVATLNEEGQLAGMQLAPPSAAEPIAPWEPPGYADVDRFDEHEVALGSGRLAVPGTVSVPHDPGSHRDRSTRGVPARVSAPTTSTAMLLNCRPTLSTPNRIRTGDFLRERQAS